MKKIIVFLLLTAGSTAYAQQPITTFILTRHAEKADDGTKDPDLSKVGQDRAQLLVKMLHQTKVDAIYSTGFRRTHNTVAPLADAKGLTVSRYEANKAEEIDQMLTKYPGGTVVISGHSNTIPWIVNYLTGTDQYKTFDDSDYNNLIIVTVVEKGVATRVTWLNY
jgi:2,3-bisphosphoglycerate-dependent phosphoglycerate mutase